ncbi:MAG: hypothetical protein HYS98_02760 [Deltaproteobacteria bacterium]|nr:hypothetical protein [Deltaproteobacteria bacterium]
MKVLFFYLFLCAFFFTAACTKKEDKIPQEELSKASYPIYNWQNIPEFSNQEKILSLVYTGNVKSELDPCG